MADEQQAKPTGNVAAFVQTVKPTRKVSVSVVAGAIASAVLWYGTAHKWGLPAEAGPWITTLVSFVLAWIVPEKGSRRMRPTVALLAAFIVGAGLAVLLLASCALTPAASLKAGYDTLDAVEKLTVTMAQTRQISKAQAAHVASLAHEAKAMLDEGTVLLTAGTAAGPAPTGGVNADLALAQNILTNLQTYLQGLQGAKP